MHILCALTITYLYPVTRYMCLNFKQCTPQSCIICVSAYKGQNHICPKTWSDYSAGLLLDYNRQSELFAILKVQLGQQIHTQRCGQGGPKLADIIFLHDKKNQDGGQSGQQYLSFNFTGCEQTRPWHVRLPTDSLYLKDFIFLCFSTQHSLHTATYSRPECSLILTTLIDNLQLLGEKK